MAAVGMLAMAAPTALAQPYGYGAPPAYGAPPGYGAPHGYGAPQGYGAPPSPQHYETPHNQTPGIDQRQAQHEAWLRQGIASGRITHREADRIRRARWDLERHERAAKADGIVTQAERHALREHATRVDAIISRNYHDGEVRPPAWRDAWR